MRRSFVPMLLVVCLSAAASAAAQDRPARPPAARQSAPTAKKPASAVVNINTAPAADLQTLPGIGAKTAERIVEYRQKNGPFKKIEELMNVRGVGEKNFLKLKAQVTVAAKVDRAPQQ